jgi:hypothetical protein
VSLIPPLQSVEPALRRSGANGVPRQRYRNRRRKAVSWRKIDAPQPAAILEQG